MWLAPSLQNVISPHSQRLGLFICCRLGSLLLLCHFQKQQGLCFKAVSTGVRVFGCTWCHKQWLLKMFENSILFPDHPVLFGFFLDTVVQCTLRAVLQCALKAMLQCSLKAVLQCVLETVTQCDSKAVIQCVLEAALQCTVLWR